MGFASHVLFFSHSFLKKLNILACKYTCSWSLLKLYIFYYCSRLFTLFTINKKLMTESTFIVLGVLACVLFSALIFHSHYSCAENSTDYVSRQLIHQIIHITYCSHDGYGVISQKMVRCQVCMLVILMLGEWCLHVKAQK